jgi:hypothetical protein
VPGVETGMLNARVNIRVSTADQELFTHAAKFMARVRIKTRKSSSIDALMCERFAKSSLDVFRRGSCSAAVMHAANAPRRAHVARSRAQSVEPTRILSLALVCALRTAQCLKESYAILAHVSPRYLAPVEEWAHEERSGFPAFQ